MGNKTPQLDINETLYKEWMELQPLSPENQKRLDQKFMLEFNYNSNHIEGNTLTYGQTKLLLMFGETTGDAKLRDYEEMKAHNVGLELVKREAKDKERPLTENFIREINRIILVEDFYKVSKSGGRYLVKVGQYKTRPNSVITATGEMFDYASPEETPALMTDLVKWYNEEEIKGELCPIQLATLFHYRYIRIHPFEDGNGRIARLLVNYILMRHDYPMVIVQSKDKESYLNVLHKCDIEVGLHPSDGANAQLEQVEPFLAYTEDIAKYALEISIRAAKGESIEEEDDLKKRIALLKKEIEIKPVSKHPKAVYDIFIDFNNRVWAKLKLGIAEFDGFFGEIQETHKVNDLDEEYEKIKVPIFMEDMFHKEVSTAPESMKIFGYDVYDNNIDTIEWIILFLGLKGVHEISDSTSKIRVKLEFDINKYDITAVANYEEVYRHSVSYGKILLDNDIKQLSKVLGECLYQNIQKKLNT